MTSPDPSEPLKPSEQPLSEPGKIVEHYPPPPDDELPPPTFKQALIGYGSILMALVVLGLLIGLLMKVLR